MGMAIKNGNTGAFACASDGCHQPGLSKHEYIATKLACAMITAGASMEFSIDESVRRTSELLIKLHKTNTYE